MQHALKNSRARVAELEAKCHDLREELASATAPTMSPEPHHDAATLLKTLTKETVRGTDEDHCKSTLVSKLKKEVNDLLWIRMGGAVNSLIIVIVLAHFFKTHPTLLQEVVIRQHDEQAQSGSNGVSAYTSIRQGAMDDLSAKWRANKLGFWLRAGLRIGYNKYERILNCLTKTWDPVRCLHKRMDIGCNTYSADRRGGRGRDGAGERARQGRCEKKTQRSSAGRSGGGDRAPLTTTAQTLLRDANAPNRTRRSTRGWSYLGSLRSLLVLHDLRRDRRGERRIRCFLLRVLGPRAVEVREALQQVFINTRPFLRCAVHPSILGAIATMGGRHRKRQAWLVLRRQEVPAQNLLNLYRILLALFDSVQPAMRISQTLTQHLLMRR